MDGFEIIHIMIGVSICFEIHKPGPSTVVCVREPLRLVAIHPEALYSKSTTDYSRLEGRVSY